MSDKLDSRVFNIDRYDALVAETFDKIVSLGKLKGAEYAGDSDRLANFRRGARNEGVDYRLIWKIYIGKHWDAIAQYVRDCVEGRQARVRLESLEGRVDDMIVYLLLFKAILQENENPPQERKTFDQQYRTGPEGQKQVYSLSNDSWENVK